MEMNCVNEKYLYFEQYLYFEIVHDSRKKVL